MFYVNFIKQHLISSKDFVIQLILRKILDQSNIRP